MYLYKKSFIEFVSIISSCHRNILVHIKSKCNLCFFLQNLRKNSKMLEMKNKKKLRGFSFSINMANFEAFHRTKKLISNLFFLKSGLVSDFCDWEKSILLQDLLSRNFLYRNVKHATPLNGGGTICEKKISLL